MLSRKRCRGTLQDYNKAEISKCQSKLWTNRNIFSWCLKGMREETVRRDGGRQCYAFYTFIRSITVVSLIDTITT